MGAMGIDEHDVVALFLAERRAETTRAAYLRDLRAFFGAEAGAEEVEAFLSLPPRAVVKRLTQYKASLISRKLSENALNRYLASIRSFLRFAHRMERATTDGRGAVDGERVQGYRDTRGVGVEAMKALLALPGGDLAGLRDKAMLRLLLENGLRRNEVVTLDVEHFEPQESRVWVKGKGKGTQRVAISLSKAATRAVEEYLRLAGHKSGALFLNATGGRLSGAGLYQIVRGYGEQLGVKLSPHKLRHSAITAVLEMTSGDLRKGQKFSRHSSIQTLMVYDDARRNPASELAEGLSGLLGG